MGTQVVSMEEMVEGLKTLPEQKLQEVSDFIDFLKWKEAVEFDEWALNLAKEKGFAHLSEEDVAKIIHEFRKESK
ncbi:MAG: hypothetical protein AB1397_05685 [bacterium]